jgi:alpha-L-fucosidase
MTKKRISRRDWVIGTSAAAAAAALPLDATGVAGRGDLLSPQAAPPAAGPTSPQDADRSRRMKWWHEARFGMFIHWGLYSVLGRHEWVMENEGIPVSEYAPLAKQFKPKPFPSRDWAKIAKETGMRYMVDSATSIPRPPITARRNKDPAVTLCANMSKPLARRICGWVFTIR